MSIKIVDFEMKHLDMSSIRKITVSEFFRHKDSDALIGEYSEECRIAGMPMPNPDIAMYEKMETLGFLDIFAVFDGGDMFGFLVLLVSPNLHYNSIIGTIESVFMLEKKRKGGGGLRLIAQAKEHAKGKGAIAMFISAPIGGVFSKVLSGLGVKNVSDGFFWELSNE